MSTGSPALSMPFASWCPALSCDLALRSANPVVPDAHHSGSPDPAGSGLASAPENSSLLPSPPEGNLRSALSPGLRDLRTAFGRRLSPRCPGHRLRNQDGGVQATNADRRHPFTSHSPRGSASTPRSISRPSSPTQLASVSGPRSDSSGSTANPSFASRNATPEGSYGQGPPSTPSLRHGTASHSMSGSRSKPTRSSIRPSSPRSRSTIPTSIRPARPCSAIPKPRFPTIAMFLSWSART